MKDLFPSLFRFSLSLFLLLLACGGEGPGPTVQVRTAPPPPPPEWAPAVGEYAEGPDTLSLLEDMGAPQLFLWAPGAREGVEWPGERVALTLLSDSSFSMAGRTDTLWIRRDEGGRPLKMVLGDRAFQRIHLGGVEGGTFRITPLRPPEELRREALSATPPLEEGEFLSSHLVELVALDPSLRLDVRYATTNNFMGEVFYSSPRAFLQRPAAEALVRAHEWLKARGYGLLLFDGYRPWYVTRMFWDATPEHLRGFVANPASGSRHNRGCAIDLTLVDLVTGEPVTMPAGFDEMSPRSFGSYPGGTSRQRWLRDFLREAMEAQGFTVYPGEWWHFDFRDWRRYRIQNQTFEELG